MGLLAIVLVGYLLWTGSAQRQFYADTAQYQSARATDNAQKEFWGCLKSFSISECAKAAVTASQEAKTAQYGLAAQREMADWTFWTFLSGVVAATAAGISVVYLAVNNIITREIGKAQVRAYLFFEIQQIIVFSGKMASYTAVVKNCGTSPALKVHFGGALAIEAEGWEWPKEEDEWVNPEPSSVHLAPGATDHFAFENADCKPVSAETQAAIRNGTLCLYGRTVVSYEDVFGEQHNTVYCFEFSGEACWKGKKAKVAKQGSRAT